MVQPGYQLSTFLYGLGAGRRRLPTLPAPAPFPDDPNGWLLGVQPGEVSIPQGGDTSPHGRTSARQTDPTTCGSVSVLLSQACLDAVHPQDAPDSPATTPLHSGQPATSPSARQRIVTDYGAAQHETKKRTNSRALAGLWTWPHRWGTPPWGAARELGTTGVRYRHQIVSPASLPHTRKVLTYAVDCAMRGYPVLLYTGSDTRVSVSAAVPRHVVVLHSPPVVADAAPTLFLFDPATGVNHAVNRDELTNRDTPPEFLGGWRHIMWAVFPNQPAQTTQQKVEP